RLRPRSGYSVNAVRCPTADGWSQAVKATSTPQPAQHGMIVPAGIVSETGVGGIALGGGIGWFSCKRALTCDNFLSLKLVTVSESQHADLFWALRGDGGWEMH